MNIQEAMKILRAPFATEEAVEQAEDVILSTCERPGTKDFVIKLPLQHRRNAIISIGQKALMTVDK